MRELASAVLMVAGGAFLLLAAVGLLRMPDVYTRMHATTKAGALGGGLMLLSVAFHYGDLGVTMRALAAVGFVLLTAPVAAHVLGRAAYLTRAPLWEGTKVDELAGRYDPHTLVLRSGPAEDAGADQVAAPVGGKSAGEPVDD